jgi:phage shock protein PspC (stress-responsive transcriptional regulator)
LTRKLIDKKIAGVCGGFAEYLEADPTMVRLLWVLLSLGLPPAGILGYIIAWIVIPKELVVLATAPADPYTPGPVTPQQV